MGGRELGLLLHELSVPKVRRASFTQSILLPLISVVLSFLRWSIVLRSHIRIQGTERLRDLSKVTQCTK